MKKQYLPQFQFNVDKGTNKWYNAMRFYTAKKLYANNIEEAEEALKFVENHFNNNKHLCINAGLLNRLLITDEETARNNQISETRIKVREVSEWEIV